MIEVIPAIIPESLDDLRNHLVRMKGLVKRVQIDVVDGSVAPVRTWPYTDSKSFEMIRKGEEGLPLWEDFEFEAHLMVKNPEYTLDEWIAAGVSSVVFHPSFSGQPKEVLSKCRAQEVEVGIAFTPSESEDIFGYIERLDPDFVQIMGNDKIGYHGVALDPRVYPIIRDIRRYFKKPIAVDIGVNEETAPKLIEAGITKLVVGSAIFGSDEPGEVIKHLQSKS